MRRDALGHTTETDIDVVPHGVEPGADAPAGPLARGRRGGAAGDPPWCSDR
ncbi:hypothetical protein [Streptomyces sp. NPDC004629]|uniref:hypothetical protein n=1 Tax=Streptomyces sp. NPDC004629 TaxID=3364705 RepID=UPI003688280A